LRGVDDKLDSSDDSENEADEDDLDNHEQNRMSIKTQLVKLEKIISKVRSKYYPHMTAKFYKDLLNGKIDLKIQEIQDQKSRK
jgi:hypothetical protein